MTRSATLSLVALSLVACGAEAPLGPPSAQSTPRVVYGCETIFRSFILEANNELYWLGEDAIFRGDGVSEPTRIALPENHTSSRHIRVVGGTDGRHHVLVVEWGEADGESRVLHLRADDTVDVLVSEPGGDAWRVGTPRIADLGRSVEVVTFGARENKNFFLLDAEFAANLGGICAPNSEVCVVQPTNEEGDLHFSRLLIDYQLNDDALLACRTTGFTVECGYCSETGCEFEPRFPFEGELFDLRDGLVVGRHLSAGLIRVWSATDGQVVAVLDEDDLGIGPYSSQAARLDSTGAVETVVRPLVQPEGDDYTLWILEVGDEGSGASAARFDREQKRVTPWLGPDDISLFVHDVDTCEGDLLTARDR